MTMGTTLRAILIAGLFGPVSLSLQAQQLLDDFNVPASGTVGGAWVETETAATGAQVNGSGQLALGATTAGREFVSQDVTGLYNPTFSSNSCLLTWAFCMQQSRTDPGGFTAGSYATGYVLGASTANFIGAGVTGYAVVFGQGGTADPLRLVRFNAGLSADAALTNIITGAAAPWNDQANGYMAVRVTFAPATGTWSLYASALTAGTFSTTNPTSAATLVGTAVNTTYSTTNLPFTGAFWNHNTGAGESAIFDNIYVPQACIPTVTFNTASNLAPENIGTVTVNMTIFPATVTGGNIIVTVVNGAGVTYGTGTGFDYTTTQAVITSTITVPVAAGATSAFFTIDVQDPLPPDDEGNETITFSLSSTTGDLVLGTALTYVQTIVDDDGLPSVNFTTTSITALESAGVQTFNLSISPPPTVAGNVTITVNNGTGIICGFGQDYQVTGFGCPPTFNVAFAIGQTAISFQATLYDDVGIAEVTEQVTFTVTAVPAGMSIGTTNVGVLNIADNDSPATVLAPGDLVIVGVNANNGACPGGSTAEDFISFFCFKPIQYGTRIILTDNGYERCTAGRWGNGEGTVELERTGPAIPAGQVITIRVTNSAGTGNVVGLAPDGGWSCTSLNGGQLFNLNAGGDQVFFMQGGVWTPNGIGTHLADYSGSIIYGFSTNAAIPWTASCATNPTQRSNLPPGMNCFSMAPTGATDYNKYIGPLTIATQRDWIIRVDNTANWSSYANCGAYNAALPNWLLAPTLPITAGGFTPGLWRGAAASTDWFDCKNWDDATVPVTTTNVRIDETAFNHCVVGITAGGNAVCASLVQTNSGTPRNLTIQNASSLAVGGPITSQRTAAGTQIAITVTGNSNLTATNFTVQGTAANEAMFRNEDPANDVSFSGDFTIGTGGAVDLQGAGVGGIISIAGNYTNAGPTEATLDETNGTFRFNGAGPQSISTGGFQEVFGNLTVSKSSGSLTLNDPLAVRGTLDLTSGLVNTTTTELLTLRATGGALNASDASFVNGPMEKIGLTNFSFPIGKGASLRPAAISGITGVATNSFRAEYFPASAYSWGTALEPTLDHVSDCEYWLIDRNSGIPDATITLSWRAPNSCGVSNLAELRVARWDSDALPAPGIWRDRGNGGTAGSFAIGTILTATTQSLFNSDNITPWTLASTTANNPLPITLVEFAAKPEGSAVRLDWRTASEFENVLFSVERSQDGLAFEHVLDVPGAFTSVVPLSYSELDRLPYAGLSYYRLRQTDVDGAQTVSPMVAVRFGPGSTRPVVVFVNGSSVTALHAFPAGSRFELLDMSGRLILASTTVQDGRTDLDGTSLAPGTYMVRITDGDRVEGQRFVY